MSLLFVGLAAVVFAVAAPGLQQPRDNVRPTGTGTGSISGIIADDQDRPLRRARVTISGSDLPAARTTITSDAGRFAFDGLPPGRYSVRAAKDGYVSMAFGASGAGRPGRAVILANDASARVTLRLPRGGVITGAVLTPEGEPAAGVAVAALVSRYDPMYGRRALATAGTVTTDDRGIYRIFGLAPGAFYIAALPRLTAGGMPGDLEIMSDAEIRRALAEVRESRSATRPGIPAPPPARPTDPAEGRPTVGLTRVFYPGTSVQQRAVPVTVRPGEVRNDINVDLEYVATATVEGAVAGPPGSRVQVIISDDERASAVQTTQISRMADSEGRFSFRPIPPGTYRIVARAFRPGARIPDGSDGDLWGETSVTVTGENISGITLTLRPALTISGTLVFDGTAPAPRLSAALRLPAALFSVSSGALVAPPSVQVEASRFRAAGVPPGLYRLPSSPPGLRAPLGPWWLKSIVRNGNDILDGQIELRESIEDAVVTFSDQASELSGVVRHADGTPVADGFVVVFSTDPRHWFHNSRRVAGVRLSARGEYAVRNLPAGDYAVVVTNDIQANEWFDPETLQPLVAAAVVVPLRENEVRAHDITLRGARPRGQ